MARAKSTRQKTNNGANVGYEAELWQMVDALRGSMDAAEDKHVVLGLIFIKYISDAFEEQHAKLEAETAQVAEPEDPDEYGALNITKTVRPLFERLVQNQTESRNLAAMRVTLLPKLISGEVRVAGHEECLEAMP